MTLPTYLELAEKVVATTGDRLVCIGDELGSLYVVHPENRKVLVQLHRGAEPAKNVRLQRVNSQNTANCLIMQNIDVSQPFCNHDQFGRGLKKKDQEEFEDSLMSVYKHHQVMCQNGYSLWSSNVTIGYNCVTVYNEYVPRPTEGTIGYDDLETVCLRAYVNLHNVKEIMDLHKIPDSWWLLAKDADSDLLGKAVGYMKAPDEYRAQIYIESKYVGIKPRRSVTPCFMSENVMDAFGVYRIHEQRRTSNSGAVNSINIFQFTDSFENARELKIITNIN